MSDDAANPGAGVTCQVAHDRRGDLDVVTVDNGVLMLAFLPQVGGRLISLVAAGTELLWRNPAYLATDLTPVTPHASWPRPADTMASWVNVGGSKTWPAPQGWDWPDEWPGPPDEVLDAGAYELVTSVDSTGIAVVSLTSAPDARTGLTVTRRFTLTPGSMSFEQTSTFRNHSQRPVRWSLWEVTQVDTAPPPGGGAGAFEVAVADAALVLTLLEVVGSVRYAPPLNGVVRVPAQEAVGKLGFPGATGRVGWRRWDGASLTQRVEVNPDVDYPDGGCPIELWLQSPVPAPLASLGGLHPNAHLVEIEVLSPLYTLAPGASATLDVAWSCSGPVVRCWQRS